MGLNNLCGGYNQRVRRRDQSLSGNGTDSHQACPCCTGGIAQTMARSPWTVKFACGGSCARYAIGRCGVASPGWSYNCPRTCATSNARKHGPAPPSTRQYIDSSSLSDNQTRMSKGANPGLAMEPNERKPRERSIRSGQDPEELSDRAPRCGASWRWGGACKRGTIRRLLPPSRRRQTTEKSLAELPSACT